MYERITDVSAELKKMATKFNIPFICASQFSRKAAGLQPKLSDLKESGALEQDADVVISLWKDNRDDGLTNDLVTDKIYIDLLKNRNGYTYYNNPDGGHEYAMMFKKDEYKFKEGVL